MLKIVVIGGTGLIGKLVTERLRKLGHEAVQASPSKGINAVTGEGLEVALSGASIVIDVSNSPSWEDAPVMEFFDRSTRNLLAAEQRAGIKHHLALSVVGTPNLTESGYFRAKDAQEKLIRDGNVHYTIVRATQFHEFLSGIAHSGGEDVSHLPTVGLQPIAAVDVADFVVEYALADPTNSVVEIAGPERGRLCDIAEKYLRDTGETLTVIPDAEAKYFGTRVTENSLTPGPNAKLGRTTVDAWLRSKTNAAV